MGETTKPTRDLALARFLDGEAEPDDGNLLAESMASDSAFRRELMALLVVDDLLRQRAMLDQYAFVDAVRLQIEEFSADNGAPFVERIKESLNHADRRLLPLPATGMHPANFTVKLVAALVLVIAPLIMLLGTHHAGDAGLGLAGWAESAQASLHRLAGILASLVGFYSIGASYLGWIKHPWMYALVGGSSLLAASVASNVAITHRANAELENCEQLIQNHTWVSYDSAYYWPRDLENVIGHPANEATEEQIREELSILRGAGFDGLFIHECRRSQVHVPRIARELGFTAIIQGIRVVDSRNLSHPETRRQVRNAISVGPLVDAFCLGELNAKNTALSAVKETLRRIRNETGRPATTSFLHKDFAGHVGDALRELEDFTVRALARDWSEANAAPDQAARAVKEALDTFRFDDKPSLLTTVFYPSGGGDRFSEQAQYEFFKAVRSLELPLGVNIVYFNSFDRPWARRLSKTSPETPEFEGFTGLFRAVAFGGQNSIQFESKKCVDLFESSNH